VEVLYIERRYSQLVWKNDAIENTLWLQLLLPFTAVKDLYLSKEFAPGIAAALEELASANLQKNFSLLDAFGHFFPGMPARKLIQAIKCLQVKKSDAPFNQTDIYV
jgi:hypothetical protein